jgi:hypothetical protein
VLQGETEKVAKDYNKFSLDSRFSTVITAEFCKAVRMSYTREPKTIDRHINGWIRAQSFRDLIPLHQIQDTKHTPASLQNGDKDAATTGN